MIDTRTLPASALSINSVNSIPVVVGSLVRRVAPFSLPPSPEDYGVVIFAHLYTVGIRWFPDMTLTEVPRWLVEEWSVPANPPSTPEEAQDV